MSEVDDTPDGYIKSRLDGNRYLPPIHRLKIPATTTQTARIRWLFELGYEIKEISRGLGVRYQQVRNMVTTIPKRAAREDLPPLTVELLEMDDVVDSLLGEELERTFQTDRKQKRRDHYKAAAAASEDDFNNTALDDEGYGQ